LGIEFLSSLLHFPRFEFLTPILLRDDFISSAEKQKESIWSGDILKHLFNHFRNRILKQTVLNTVLMSVCKSQKYHRTKKLWSWDSSSFFFTQI